MSRNSLSLTSSPPTLISLEDFSGEGGFCGLKGLAEKVNKQRKKTDRIAKVDIVWALSHQ